MSYSFSSFSTESSSAASGANGGNVAQDLLLLLNGVSGSSGSGQATSTLTSTSYSVNGAAGVGFSSGAAGVGLSSGAAGAGFSSSSMSAAGASMSLAGASMNAGAAVLSQIELAILRSANPIEVNESEEITVIGQRGIWLNKAEINAWKGDLALSEYKIYEDSNPEIITKKVTQIVEYVQELAIRYLRPPTPPAPGEIVISMEANISTGPAPPLIIRQQPARATTPEPLIIREAPPQPPMPVGPKRITISGKRLPPPPRKVVIERLAPLPSKPQNVIIERWLPYGEVKRRVIFNKSTAAAAVAVNPRNVIVQWEAPEVQIKKEIKYLGVIRANPVEYVQRYGADLKLSTALPQFVLDIKTPADVGVLAADYRAKALLELEGQLEGFKFVDLDAEGLSEYRAYLLNLGIQDLVAARSGASASFSASGAGAASGSLAGFGANSASASAYGFSNVASSLNLSSGSSSAALSASEAAGQIFDMIDADKSGSISVEEAEKVVLKLNSRLKRSYGEAEVKSFFSAVSGGSLLISRVQFMSAFDKLAGL